ncbi:hypothetical protein PV326_001573 [Microctonus aethiopoides]|uniref:Nuclear-export cofactor Arc1-like N-terminal domain-containing protein n=1 Tax=Microctonus aethiopoides TaxID=144406 RepID=A0AA39FXB2_9HYME|nr:hypothetical protein PV326_001573 [Microctonus aethiopoides]KAK0177570.1 hypothetical protein PV328_001610 [Microctonus aethiopoides]
MVLCGVECVEKVSDYLEVPVKNLHLSINNVVAADDLIKSQTIEGFCTIVQELAKKSNYPDMLGNDRLTRAITKQWLEYAIVNINYADNVTNAKRILKELNMSLRDNTFITGTSKTVADVVIYYALHSIMNELTHQEKAEYVNISRWFDYIQQEEKLRKNLNLINFELVHLYI